MAGKLQRPTNNNSPAREQWALIAQQQRQQYQDFKQQQRQRDHLRKLAFREALDQHVQQKRNQGNDEKQQDQRYREELIRLEERMKEQQAKTKMEKVQARREVEKVNQEMLGGYVKQPLSLAPDIAPNSPYNIGQAREQQVKIARAQNAKALSHDLQSQLHAKHRSLIQQRQSDLQQQLTNQQYIFEKQQQRLKDINKNRHQGQNMAVYGYYQQLKREKERKERELNYKLVQQPAVQKMVEEETKIRKEIEQRSRQNQQVKDSLMEQMEKHERDRQNSKGDMDGYSYGMMASMFEDKRKGYDKSQYLRVLKEQEEQHKRKKDASKYMNDEEYRLNMNQLNKAVNGQYSNPNYQDRSPANIGNPEQLSRKKDDLYFKQLAGGVLSSHRANSPMQRQATTPAATSQYATVPVAPSSHIPTTPGKPELYNDLQAVRRRMEQLKSYNILSHS